MTPQEEQLLNSLVERVDSTQLQEKDPDAEGLLNRSLGSNPDALYILAQTVLVQNIAIDQAKAQIAQLQQAQQAQAQPPSRATSFLGNLLGHHDPAPTQAPAYAPPPQAYVPPPPPPAYGQPQFQQQPAQYVPVASGQPSFLRGALQTAAGMAAGALAFEGVEAVLHGLGGFGRPGFGWGGSGFGMGGIGMGPGVGMMGAGFERPVEEVVNNYYDQPAPGHESLNQGGFAPGGEESHIQQSAGQFADQGGAQFSDASYNTTSANDMGNDQGNFDNSGFDDNSGYDNSGVGDSSSFDAGGGFDDGGDLGGDGGGDLL